MSYKFCEYCGAKTPSTHTFCENCGQKIGETDQESQSETSPSYSGPYQPQQQNVQQSYDSRKTSMSGSYDAVPRTQPPYVPQKRRGMHPALKVLLIAMFALIPAIIMLAIFFGLDIFDWFL